MSEAAARNTFVVHVRAAPADVWRAMTDPEQSRRWNNGLTLESDLTPGAPLRYLLPDGTVATDATIEAIEPERGWALRVRHPFHPALVGEPPYRQSIEIEPVNETVTRVTLTVDDVAPGSATEQVLVAGTRFLLDSFKSLLETGEPLAG